MNEEAKMAKRRRITMNCPQRIKMITTIARNTLFRLYYTYFTSSQIPRVVVGQFALVHLYNVVVVFIWKSYKLSGVVLASWLILSFPKSRQKNRGRYLCSCPYIRSQFLLLFHGYSSKTSNEEKRPNLLCHFLCCCCWCCCQKAQQKK